MTQSEVEAYDRGYAQGKIQGRVEERTKITYMLKPWADATRPNNPDIAIGYDHAIALIESDFSWEVGMDWDGEEKDKLDFSLKCIRCGKPTITISQNMYGYLGYTRCSYCNDCLREGMRALKQIKEQKND